MRVIVGMTGSSGAVLGIEVLKALHAAGVETHLVLSQWARATIEMETDLSVNDVRVLADVSYGPKDQAAAISSGSFRTEGMVIVPCSMKTLAAIRAGFGDNLVSRAADVVLKERRNLVIVPRETPLSPIHLENMLALARMGVAIVPPMPAFYQRPASVAEIIDDLTTRILDQLDIPRPGARRWDNTSARRLTALPNS